MGLMERVGDLLKANLDFKSAIPRTPFHFFLQSFFHLEHHEIWCQHIVVLFVHVPQLV